MITKGCDLEFDDGTPVNPSSVRWEGNYVYIADGADMGARPPRFSGYFEYKTGDFSGSSRRQVQGVREVVRGPEPYEEFFL